MSDDTEKKLLQALRSAFAGEDVDSLLQEMTSLLEEAAGDSLLSVLPGESDLDLLPSQLSFIKRLGLQMTAIAKFADLLGAEEKSKSRYIALQRIGTEITRLATLDRVLQMVTEYALELLDADLACLGLIDAEKSQLQIRVTAGAKTESLLGLCVEFGGGIGWASVQAGHSLVSNDYLNDPRLRSRVLPALLDEEVKAGVVAPLLIGEKAIGVLYAFNRRTTDWPEDSGMLLTGLASQAAIAIENARLLEESSRVVTHKEALYEIGKLLSSSLDMEAVLQTVVRHAALLTDAESSMVTFLNEETGFLEAKIAYGMPFTEQQLNQIRFRPGEGATGIAAKTGDPLAIEDFENSDIYVERLRETDSYYPLRNILSVPIKLRGKVIGVIDVANKRAEGEFGKEDIGLLLALVDQAAIAIENARVYGLEKEQVRRLEELGQLKNEFISIASHEFRTPLTIIKGITDLLLKRDDGFVTPAQQKHLLEEVGDEAMRLNELVGDVLEVSRIESASINLRLENFDLAELVTEVLELCSAEAIARNIKLGLDLEQRPTVFADAHRTQQVLMNLLSNAMKYSQDGSAVEVSLRASGEFAQVCVSDNGVGISPEQIFYLFGKFNRLPNARKGAVKGTGLGLYIVKGLVEAQGGSVSVESMPGMGSKFIFTLPLAVWETIPDY